MRSSISRRSAGPENNAYWKNLVENMKENNLDPAQVPVVIQYNKRDLPDVAPVEELRKLLNPTNVPDYEAVAAGTGQGVFDTLKAVAKLVMLLEVRPELGCNTVGP